MLRRALLLVSTLSFVAAVQAAPAVGQPAPEIALKDASGKAVKLSDFRGKYVVLEWTNPGCPYVKKHYNSGNMAATQQDAAAKGAVWLSVNSTEKGSFDYMEPARLVVWQKERKLQAAATLMDEDGVAGKAYGARTTPHMYIVDPRACWCTPAASTASPRAIPTTSSRPSTT